MEYPGNGYKQRGLKMPDIPEKLSEVLIASELGDVRGHCYVRIKYTVWPELYGEQRPILFPTMKAALRFAENNLAPTRPVIRVYTPLGTLVKTFAYENPLGTH